MHTSTRIACSCGMVKVSVVISATPIVAVSPGSAPMMMRSSVAQKTLRIPHPLSRWASAPPNCSRLCSMPAALRQADEEDALEHERHKEAREHALHDADPHETEARLRLEPGPPLECGDEERHEDRGREPE